MSLRHYAKKPKTFAQQVELLRKRGLIIRNAGAAESVLSSHLRTLLFNAIEQIEIAIRTQAIYHLSTDTTMATGMNGESYTKGPLATIGAY